MKSREHRAPKTSKQITFGDDQGNVFPPKSRPIKSINVNAKMLIEPAQSTALTPSTNGVLGLCTSRKKSNKTNVTPQQGRLIHQHHLQVARSVKTPPRIGPRAPAMAQIASQNPKYNVRRLKPVSKCVSTRE